MARGRMGSGSEDPLLQTQWDFIVCITCPSRVQMQPEQTATGSS